MTPGLVLKAFLLGLSTGVFCIGFCLPLVGPVLLSDEKAGITRSASRIGLFLVGRLAAYLVFGIVFGALGARLSQVLPTRFLLIGMVYCLLGMLAIVFGLVQSFPHFGLCRLALPCVNSGWYLAVLGFLAGINLCPPFLLALTAVLESGGVLRGALFFLVFFMATSVYFLPLLFSSLASRFSSLRFAARVAAVLAGAYFINLGLHMVASR
ncbi:MAG: sulfite exporter TauE/SafE family protein [candidate division WOR-3 bacterium]